MECTTVWEREWGTRWKGGDKGWREVWVRGVGEEEGYIGNTPCYLLCYWYRLLLVDQQQCMCFYNNNLHPLCGVIGHGLFYLLPKNNSNEDKIIYIK